MKINIYKDKELILRDELALDRTHLANERTILAYFRTSLTSFVVALTLLKFFPEKHMQFLSFFFFFLSGFVFIVGVLRYFTINKKLDKIIIKK